MGTKRKLQPGAWSIYVNKYSISLFCFVVWIGFFDRNNLYTQSKLKSVISELESQKKEYQILYEQAKEEKKILDSDKEKYAREKYFMHKDNEEVFIIKKNEQK